MDLAKARAFVQVADCGSLTKAAALCGTDQSIVSRQVGALERDLGGRLFHRTGRGVTLTELGSRLLPRMRALLAQADDISESARAVAGVPSGSVRLGVLPSMASPLVSTLYELLRERFPSVNLRVDEGSGGQLEEWVATGHVDMAVLFRDGAREDGTTRLRKVSMYLVGRSGDRLTRTASVAFARLDGLPMVLPGVPSALRTLLEQLAKRKKVALDVALEVDSLAVQKDVVAHTGIHTVLSRHAVHRELAQGTLQASRITAPAIERTLALGMTRQHPLSLAAREVARLVRQAIEAMPRE